MSGNTNNQIESLLSKKSAAASKVTNPLKNIGNGNMLDGVKTIHSHGFAEGERIGFVSGEKKGAIETGLFAGGLMAAIYLLPKGYRFIKQKWNERKIKKKDGATNE